MVRLAPGSALTLALAAAACTTTVTVSTIPPPPQPLPDAGTAARPPDPAPPTFRLPGDVKPLRYALDLTVVPDAERAPGRVHVDAEVVQPTRVVWLNATDLAITEARLGGAPARILPGGTDFVGLAADRDLPRGPLAIDVTFTAGIDREKSRGIYSVREGADAYAYTFFEASDARRAFPCFDEPQAKVPWQLTLHAKADHVALANAPVVRETPEPNGMKRVELAPTQPLPSYLVAFVVGPFEVIDDGVAGRAKTPVRFIVPKGRAGELGYAKEITPRIVTALEDYFDMPYPFGKLDVAVVPRYWGTMEHPGIVAMGQTLTLIRPEQATRERKQAYANILAHELAHYWFGDLVTMAWWDDTWLNEALGEWMDMIITDAVEPAWRMRDGRVGIATGAMSSDETLSIRAIRQPVTSPEGIAAAFDAEITYFKGSSVLRMFENWTRPEKWRAFIRKYIRAHAGGNATADDFLAAARADLGAPVEAGLRSFLEQPGVPRISVQADCPPGRPAALIVRQTRALPAVAKEATARTWTLPVCVRFGTATSDALYCQLVDAPEARLPIEPFVEPRPAPRPAPGALAIGAWHGCPTWIVPNAGAFGYYRSAIDPRTAPALLDPKTPIGTQAKLTPAERMMLISDVRAAVQRDELSIDKQLALVPAVVADPDPKVAEHGFALSSIHASGLDDGLFRLARAWDQRTFAPLAKRLGWVRRRADTDELQALRVSAINAAAQDDALLGAQAELLAGKWLSDRSGIEDDLVPVALSTAAWRGGLPWFARLVDAARHARDRSEQQRILRALGGFRDPKAAQQALDLVLGTEFDLRDTIGIVGGLMFHRETRDLALAFTTAHLDELLGRMRSDEASWALGGFAGAFCDADRLAKVTALVGPRAAKIDGAQAAVNRGIEQSQQCIDELAHSLPALRAFLQRR